MARKKRRQFPLTLEIEWPDGLLAHPRSRRRIFAGSGLVIALLLSGAGFWFIKSKAPAVGTAVVHVTSEPPATAYVDGNKRGATPLDLSLPGGAHQLSLVASDYLPRTTYLTLREGERSALDLPLWLRQPPLRALKAPFPGAALSDANFSASGEIALTVALPDGQQQVWLTDGSGDSRQVGPTASRISLAPDGINYAYLAPATDKPASSAASPQDALWVGSAGAPAQVRYSPGADTADKKLSDVTWTSDGGHLVLAVQVRTAGHHWTELLSIASDGSSQQLARFPSDVVAGSFRWSPKGNELAFLARSDSTTSLCLIAVPKGTLRYLADLKPSDSGSPLPVAPISWSPQGEPVYSAVAASTGGSGGWLLGATGPGSALFLLPPQGLSRQAGGAGAQFPVWLDDRTVLAVRRPASDKPLVLDSVDALSGHSQSVGQLDAPSGADYAVRWDAAHARAIVAVRRSSTVGTGLDFGWVNFRPAVQS